MAILNNGVETPWQNQHLWWGSPFYGWFNIISPPTPYIEFMGRIAVYSLSDPSKRIADLRGIMKSMGCTMLCGFLYISTLLNVCFDVSKAWTYANISNYKDLSSNSVTMSSCRLLFRPADSLLFKTRTRMLLKWNKYIFRVLKSFF